MGSIKYHFIFIKVAAGFYAGCLFSGVGSNEMFAHWLTFLSPNSKSTNVNALINFLAVVRGPFSLKRARAQLVGPNRLVKDVPRS